MSAVEIELSGGVGAPTPVSHHLENSRATQFNYGRPALKKKEKKEKESVNTAPFHPFMRADKKTIC